MITFLRWLWCIAHWILPTLAAAYAVIIVYAYPHDHEAHISAAMVAKIEAQRLTVADVDGQYLPPQPDPTQANATVAGIDANDNGIRDDAELAIFAKYPISTTTRAAELQYAMELQMEFTDVIDSPTLVAVIEQEGRGYMCIFDDKKTNEVESLVFNTKERKDYREEVRAKYMASFGLASSGFCDLDPKSI